MRLLSAIKHDIRFQFRHGFYYAYLFVSLIYIGILRIVPTDLKSFFGTWIIFTDPSVLGFFFVGGVILLEKDQNMLESLFVTPLRVREYFISKVISLALLSLVSSSIIIIFGYGIEINPLPLLIGVPLTSIFFTLIGMTLAVRASSLNQYILISIVYTIPFVLPLLGFLNLFKTPLYYILPGKASLIAVAGIFHDIGWLEWLYLIVNLIIWITIAYQWASRWFYKYVILGIGEGK